MCERFRGLPYSLINVGQGILRPILDDVPTFLLVPILCKPLSLRLRCVHDWDGNRF